MIVARISMIFWQKAAKSVAESAAINLLLREDADGMDGRVRTFIAVPRDAGRTRDVTMFRINDAWASSSTVSEIRSADRSISR